MPEIQPCILLPLSKKSALRAKQLEVTDPKVLALGLAESEDLDFVRMMNSIENRTPLKDIPAAIGSVLKNLSVKDLNNWTRIIVRDDTEVYIPKGERPEIMRILHNTHVSDDTMSRQCKSRLFWPRLRADLHKLYRVILGN